MVVINTWYGSDIFPYVGSMVKLLMAATVSLRSFLFPLSITSLPPFLCNHKTLFCPNEGWPTVGYVFQYMHNHLHVLCDKPALAQKRSILVSIFSHLTLCAMLQTMVNISLMFIPYSEVQCCWVWSHVWPYPYFGAELHASCHRCSDNYPAKVEPAGKLRLCLSQSSCKALC